MATSFLLRPSYNESKGFTLKQTYGFVIKTQKQQKNTHFNTRCEKFFGEESWNDTTHSRKKSFYKLYVQKFDIYQSYYCDLHIGSIVPAFNCTYRSSVKRVVLACIVVKPGTYATEYLYWFTQQEKVDWQSANWCSNNL